jgi:ABC-type glycerol-3-phosphate transport system permease component
MFCQHCGAQLEAGARFCNRCGNAIPGPSFVRSSADPAEVLNNHLRVLGILWVIYSIFHILMGCWTLAFSHYFLPTMAHIFAQQMNSDAAIHFFDFFKVFYTITFVYSLATGVLGICAGWALLRREPHGRTLALVAAFICLISIPFGTAIGVYTLVILLPDPTGPAYEQLSRAVTSGEN